ncbi:tetratricopeptide repeat protein [Streptomyces scabiei]|nr:tetratricopeptide repeat protein [Streptomyces scabiei]MDX2689429.1 tetratricopeptide repeat protein [Streptomyces scabiei]MDX2753265.1 tetratricopeptide repeat protein [Streptomyces scabiei]MDX2807408.1 tetratricopeptide repeat protein [Streptomyces scabiei]MDX3124221.1 tetratricopeptide repeat protein [Streptomyces scabiei]MDX3200432.1 tetratricopeptide repeat protein [Streptomyces scabiei]
MWVGRVPRLAAAFQPRSQVRQRAEEARCGGSEVVLSGGGGVGKSQLAASLARDLRDRERADGARLDIMVWAKATEPDQIITAYAQAAEQLRLPGVSADDSTAAARKFLQWLAVTERRWLVVLDDITDPASVEEWWPDGGTRNGWVLATTRRDDAQFSGQGRTLIRLSLYTPEEARAYLHRRLTDAGHPHLHAPDRADELAVELGHLPLALGHAAAYIINKRRTMVAYLARLRDTRSRLGDLLPPSADTEGYGRPVITALLVSLDAVEKADATRLARPLLYLASLMDPLGHPAALWTTPPALHYLRTSRPARRRRLRRHQPTVTEGEIHSALECLRTYALITQDTETAPVRLHALTARAVRETIPPDTLPALARSAADTILSLWPTLDHEDRELSATLRANTTHLDRHTRPALWQATTHPCIHQVSGSLTEAGLYHQAVEHNQETLRYSQDLHGPEHPETLTACQHLAVSYHADGSIEQALNLSEHVLADRERVLGPDHLDTITARNNLAQSCNAAGRIQEALDLGERALADSEQILGPSHQATITARHGLAVSYCAAGRIQEALYLGERVLADSERTLGPDHLDSLTARHHLAVIYSAAGSLQQALDLSERVLVDAERILGPDHPNTITARNNLASFQGAAAPVQQPDTAPSVTTSDLQPPLTPPE